MSRPPFRPITDHRKLVRSLAAMGQRHEHIARLIGIRSPKTLRKHFRKEIDAGSAEAIAAVAGAAYDMAVSGRFPGLTRFWLSTVGGSPAFDSVEQKDQDEIEEFTGARNQISAE